MPILNLCYLNLSRVGRCFLLVAAGLLLSGCQTTLVSMYDSLADSSPEPPIGLESNLRLAAAAMSGGDVDSALKLYRSAAEAHPTELAPQRGLADTYYRVKAYPEARAAYARLGTLEGGQLEHLLGHGRIALATGDVDGAKSSFGQALEIAPSDARARNGIAVALDGLEQCTHFQEFMGFDWA